MIQYIVAFPNYGVEWAHRIIFQLARMHLRHAMRLIVSLAGLLHFSTLWLLLLDINYTIGNKTNCSKLFSICSVNSSNFTQHDGIRNRSEHLSEKLWDKIGCTRECQEGREMWGDKEGKVFNLSKLQIQLFNYFSRLNTANSLFASWLPSCFHASSRGASHFTPPH